MFSLLTCLRSSFLCIALGSLMSTVVLYFLVKFWNQSMSCTANPSSPEEQTPLILIGSSMIGSMNKWKRYNIIHQDQLNADRCPYHCEITSNESRYQDADLVVVTLYREDAVSLQPLLSFPKMAGQKWAFFALESPLHGMQRVSTSLAQRLDWSITYRIKPSVTDEEIDLAIAKKRHAIAAVISNPNHHRLKFIKTLQNYIQVDVYGKVTGLPCPGEKNNSRSKWECRETVSQSYWFYLAIENAICEDYVTEKLFEQFPYFIVPISVAGNWSDSLAPPGSFIRYNSTAGVQALADDLHRLMENPNEYRKYFEWKKGPNLPQRMEHHTCRLCRALHDSTSAPPSMNFTSARELVMWYVEDSHCSYNF